MLDKYDVVCLHDGVLVIYEPITDTRHEWINVENVLSEISQTQKVTR